MKLWGGRFEKAVDDKVNDFNSSINVDSRMFKQDIQGSIAHAKMLGNQNIISTADSEAICAQLRVLLQDIENGKVEFSADAEDIHMNIETLLTERLGDIGKRLHTARSRNDQVTLDLRLYLLNKQSEISQMLQQLCIVICDIAEQHLETVMPGYTHLQKAQPVTLAHHLMAYYEMFKRDMGRLQDWGRRTNLSPLGAGALAGSTYPIDRESVANDLGFDAITQNTMDSVSDRDYAIELTFDISMIMMHLSRFCEELILWSSHEFSFIEMDDAYSTGSSIMPQKKNPDVAELIRGKSGRTFGNLINLLTVMKGLPLAYNKDMQEDKPAVFDSVDTIMLCLPVFTGMIKTMRVNKENMYKGAQGGFTNATDAADYLVKKGLPFRQAHECVGKLVLLAIKQNKALDQLSLADYKSVSEIFEQDVYEAISLHTCVNNRKFTGCAAPKTVLAHIKKAKQELDYKLPTTNY